jgi:PKD repeat protein
LSKGNPTTWRWEFGAGSVYTKQQGANIYLKPGKYTVKLTVTNAQGSTDTKEVRDAIVVQELPPCLYTKWVSEDGGSPPASCPVGYLAAGIKCRGKYCDDVSLYCCPYLDGTNMGEELRPWSEWFSEESPNYLVDPQGWVKSIRCRGPYSDDLSLQFVRNDLLPNSQLCNWMPQISDEQKEGAQCPEDWFVSGMQCTGASCDNVSIYCCQPQ